MSEKKLRKSEQKLFSKPIGRVFSREDITDYVARYGLSCGVDYLITRGNLCNWRNRKGENFPNVANFCNYYHRLYIKTVESLENKLKREGLWTYEFLSELLFDYRFEIENNINTKK